MLQYLKSGTVKRLHVDRRILASNKKTGGNAAAITVQTSKGPLKARRAEVLGHCTFEQAGEVVSEVDGSVRVIKPLSCGARVWIRTTAAVEVIT
jgi:hypothetical protein